VYRITYLFEGLTRSDDIHYSIAHYLTRHLSALKSRGNILSNHARRRARIVPMVIVLKLKITGDANEKEDILDHATIEQKSTRRPPDPV